MEGTYVVTYQPCAVEDHGQGCWWPSIHCCIGHDPIRTYMWTDRRFSSEEAAIVHATRLVKSMHEGMFAGAVAMPGQVHKIALLETPTPRKRTTH